ERVPAELVVADPIATVAAHPTRHARIALPADIYGPSRKNPLGRDYSLLDVRTLAAKTVTLTAGERETAGAIVEGKLIAAPSDPVTSPTDRSRVIGHASTATPADIDRAAAAARKAQPAWNRLGGSGRAAILRAMGDALDAEMDSLIALLSLEAGKSLNDGVAEVREAVDFCRYYADLAERQFGAPTLLPGPVGETNHLELRGRGVFACISPWNFPLAIFTGQIAAALAAGNAVLAKPAEQTPLIAAEAVKLYHAAGLNPDLLALLPGRGETVGVELTSHEGLDGVAFTGGTDTAWKINQNLSARRGPIVPFIAETGGLNGMFVDTTAQREQVIDDVIVSAFGSAGQRCSALRLLFLPHDTADGVIEGLMGAMDALVLGDPALAVTDVGPVIDAEAKTALDQHLARLKRDAKVLHALSAPAGGTFFAPVLAEIPAADFLEREVFGPVLHVVRYAPEDLDQVAGALAARRYGLTLGIHSRIESFAAQVQRLVPAGNCYVNRSMTGAVVGVQPFGGEGLSGTGPKAGGPHALLRYAVERAVSVNITAQGGDPALLNL
ncbi:MAG: bifunctional proline dehydrogenase/L-glutamate gamma-semialdehyde dehydrogenase PutA, partial [Alphaproteobacteria bacterium]|nr:bifunctional proline dehydrogenase/L-glutamate gamma-semialdehyde dehydrogenase PutA [Alphaproteobacteria bacterium]